MKTFFALLYRWCFGSELFEESYLITSLEFRFWPEWAVDFMFDNSDSININVGDKLIRNIETGQVEFIGAKSVHK